MSHRGAIIIPLLSLIAILLCGNNNDSTKKPRCKSSVLFLRGFLDALARVPVAPLGYRLRVAPGPRLPRRSLAYGRFAPGAHRSFAQARQKAKAPVGPWGLSRRFAFGFCPARRSQTLRPGTPPGVALRSTKGQGLRLRPASPPLPFFRFALPCLVLRLVRLCSLAALLGRVPPRRGPAIAARFSRGFAGLRPSGFLAPFGGGALAWSLSLPALAVRLCRPAAFFCECFRCPFNHPPAPPILAGGARKLCAHFSPCDLICHCVHHRYTGVAMVH